MTCVSDGHAKCEVRRVVIAWISLDRIIRTGDEDADARDKGRTEEVEERAGRVGKKGIRRERETGGAERKKAGV